MLRIAAPIRASAPAAIELDDTLSIGASSNYHVFMATVFTTHSGLGSNYFNDEG
jgi:hypothetical protein